MEKGKEKIRKVGNVTFIQAGIAKSKTQKNNTDKEVSKQRQ